MKFLCKLLPDDPKSEIESLKINQVCIFWQGYWNLNILQIDIDNDYDFDYDPSEERKIKYGQETSKKF